MEIVCACRQFLTKLNIMEITATSCINLEFKIIELLFVKLYTNGSSRLSWELVHFAIQPQLGAGPL